VPFVNIYEGPDHAAQTCLWSPAL